MKLFALLSEQGTACNETVLIEADYNNPIIRAAVEASINTQSYDPPILGTWTDVSDNEACREHYLGCLADE